MKKICIITTVSTTMQSFVIETAKYLHNKCNYDVTLICSNDEQFKSTLPEYIHYIPVYMSRGVDFSAIFSIIKFIKIFRREKFDLVQYSTPNASCYASIAARICKVPVRLYCQWGIRYVGFEGVKRKIFKFIEKIICRNSTVIRSQSFLNKKFAISEGLCKEDKIGLIGIGGTIGVDMSKYDINQKEQWCNSVRRQYNIDANDFVFGFSGRISAEKGCAELLTSFKNISDTHTNTKLLIVGGFDEQSKINAELLNWAKNSPSVIFTGKIGNDRMREYYSAMDVLVHPTYREGFGMVLQEAGALALTILTTRINGASEVMEDGKSCVLAEPKNAEDLQEKMQYLLDNIEISRQLGQSAYERTRQYFDRPIMLENQRQDYQQLLGDVASEQ